MRSDEATESAAVAAAYAEHGTAVYRYCLRLLGDPQLAQDALQEVMVRVCRHPEALEGQRGPVRPWMMTVARNVVIDSARARKSRPVEVTGESASAAMDVAGDVVSDDEIDRMIESWQMVEALRRLTPAHRDVLVQMYYLDRSVAETARALGVPSGTVKSRSYYALRALRAELHESGVAP